MSLPPAFEIAFQPAFRPPFGASGDTPAPDLRAQVIAALYSNDEQGAMYDPSDLGTLFQDSAGTTPVTADSQPVGRMLDVSGNGNHATQTSAARRPLYRTDGTLHWLEFDGVDDELVFSHGISGTDPRAIFVGLDPDSSGGVSRHVIITLGGSTSRLGEAWVLGNEAAGLALRVGGNTVYDTAVGLSPTVISHYWNTGLGTTNNDAVARKDGTALGVASSNNQTINTNGGTPENGEIGIREFDGKIYSIIASRQVVNAATIGLAESYVALKSGVTL